MDIKSFLEGVPGSDQIIVKKLNTVGQNSAFSIGLPSKEALDEVFSDSFWPEGIVLREFSFDKQFFQKSRENQLMA